MVTPVCAVPMTVQTPAHDWTQLHEIAPAPQGFAMHSTSSAPPARAMQSCPAWQVSVLGHGQMTDAHAAVLMVQLPFVQVATVRPAPAQSS
jgi:hypothetical protein